MASAEDHSSTLPVAVATDSMKRDSEADGAKPKRSLKQIFLGDYDYVQLCMVRCLAACRLISTYHSDSLIPLPVIVQSSSQSLISR